MNPVPEAAAVRLQQAEVDLGTPIEAAPAIGGHVASRVRAIVNGRPILDDELREVVWQELRLADQLPEPKRSHMQAEILKNGLEQLIEREVIISDAEDRLQKKERVLAQLREYAGKEYEKQLRSIRQRSGVQTDDELREILAAQGLTLPNLRRRIERQFMANEYMRSRIFPLIDNIGHPEIRRYYNEHPGEFQNEDRVRWQDIFIDGTTPHARQRAEEIARQAQQGVDFLQLVRQYDQGDSHYRNGEGLGQKRGEIKPIEVEPLLFEMQVGQIGLVEMPTGFHVIRLVERVYAGPQPFDDKTQNEIRKKLQTILADREYKRIVAELKRKAAIQVFLDD